VIGGISEEGSRNTTMHMLRKFPLFVLTGALFCGAVSLAQSTQANVRRIVDKIDESQLTTLHGNTHPAAIAKNDLGRVNADLPMTDLVMVLSRSAEQQAAFEKFVADLYDANSPVFHQWLTPEQVGARFGPSDADIATVSSWLAGRGFTVNEVTKDHMSIRFSGTASLVEGAFHTEIHNLNVNGAAHIGNMSDPQIPTALTPVVTGIKSLHNFFPKPLHHLGGQVTRDSETGKWKRIAGAALGNATAESTAPTRKPLVAATPAATRPQYGINVGGANPYLVEDVGPWDFATIYNILPLWNKSGAPIDGTGQTIAIAGTSDIDVGQAVGSETGVNGNNDVLTFRTYFGLPTTNAANAPKRISGNSQPLTVCTSTASNAACGISDLTENSLDVEWSGSVAPNAQIILVSSYPASTSDDNLYDSESYIVNNKVAPIMNVSYGECELGLGTAGNVQYYNLWQTAAAEGISVFVAAGDSGSASCDDGNLVAESGLTVSGIASTPWNTAVGGTDFNWCAPDTANGSTTGTICKASPYWSSTAITSAGSTQPVTTALGYVPETPWNGTCANPLTLSWVQDVANILYKIPATGANGVTNTEQACNFLADYDFNYSQGSYGLANSTYGYPYILNLLSTAGGSGGASNCVVGAAVTNSTTGEMTGCAVISGPGTTGATTNPDTAAPQGSLATFNNGWPKPNWQTGVSGIPSDGVRDLPDVSFFASDGFVSSSAYLICVSAATSNTPCSYSTYSEPFYQEVGGTSVATPAMAGVMALINQKAGATQGLATPELYKLAAAQTYSQCSAESVTVGSSACLFNDIDTGSNAMPCDMGVYSTTTTTYATPNCTASYSTFGVADSNEGLGILTGNSAGPGYDLATGLGSLNVANVVNAWTPNASALGGTSAVTVSVIPSPTALNLTQTLSVTGTVVSSPTGGVTPTGTVSISAGTYTASMALTAGAYSFTVPENSLSAGVNTITVGYSGDATYTTGGGTAIVTVEGTGATFTLSQNAVVASPATIAPGASATAVITVTAVKGYTGTVSLTCTQTSTTATGGDGATCSIPAAAVAMGGTATATVSTTAATKARLEYPNLPGKGKGWIGAGGGAVLACLTLLGIPARRRKWLSMLGILVLMVSLGALAGCGGGGGSSSGGGGTSDPGTTAGVYTFTVLATGNPTVTPTVSTTFTVTVN